MKGLRIDKKQSHRGERAKHHFCFYGNSQSIPSDGSPLALDVMTFTFSKISSKTRVYRALVSHSGFVCISISSSSYISNYPSTFDAMFDEADKSLFFTDKDCYFASIHTPHEEIRVLEFRLNDILPHITDLSHLSDTQCYEIADAVQEVARKFHQIIYPV